MKEIWSNGDATDFSYDNAGNLVEEIQTGVGSQKERQAFQYTYDQNGQLTHMGGTHTADYTYDVAGNRTAQREEGVTTTYTYNARNQLVKETQPSGTQDYTYDGNGNLVQVTGAGGTARYTYDASDHMLYGKNQQGEESFYRYNSLGVRLSHTEKRANQNSGHQNNAFAPGSRGDEALLSAVLEKGRNAEQKTWETTLGTVVQNNYETVTKDYVTDYTSQANRAIFIVEKGSLEESLVYDQGSLTPYSMELSYAPDTKRVPDPLTGRETAPGTNPGSDIGKEKTDKLYLHGGLLGTNTFATDRRGEVVAHRITDQWGIPQMETRADMNHAGRDSLNNYTGYSYDEVTRTYFAQNRFYDPEAKRFLQEDRLQSDLNWYLYCGNNPLTWLDPLGLRQDGKAYRSSSSAGRQDRIKQNMTPKGQASSVQTKPHVSIPTPPKPQPTKQLISPTKATGQNRNMGQSHKPVNDATRAIMNAQQNQQYRHQTLAVLGMLPVIGIPCDLANAGFYASEKDASGVVASGLGVALAGGLGYWIAKGDKVLDGAKVAVKGGGKGVSGAKVDKFLEKNVNPNFQKNLKNAFASDAKVTVLAEDKVVYRYHGGDSGAKSYWYTPNKTTNPGADLALPNGNSYTQVDKLIIPKGTEVLEGTVAPNFGQPGGGYQFYVADPSVVKKY